MPKVQRDYDPRYAGHVFKRLERIRIVNLLFENFVVSGEENLSGNRHRVYISNHKSHADYFIAWLYFHRNGIKMPMIPAGENLNQPLLKFIGLDLGRLGAYFVDRDLMKNHGTESRHHAREVYEFTKKILASGKDLLVYPGGGRSYDNGILFNDFKLGIIRAVVSAGEDIDIVPVAVDYDKRIEFFKSLHKYGRKGLFNRLGYYGLDLSAFFVTRPLMRLTSGISGIDAGNAYMSIGKPRKLAEIVGDAKGVRAQAERVRDFSMEEITNLYNGLNGRKR